jgi:hypothetical protein
VHTRSHKLLRFDDIAAKRAAIGDHTMNYDPNGLVSRWSGAARRGTIAHIAYALVGLVAVAFVLNRFVA